MISKVAGSALCLTCRMVVLSRRAAACSPDERSDIRDDRPAFRYAQCGLRIAPHQHETVFVHLSLPPGWNKDGGFERLDHHRTRCLPSRRHPATVIDRDVDQAGFPAPRLAPGLDRVCSGKRRLVGVAPIAATRTLTICTGSLRLSCP